MLAGKEKDQEMSYESKKMKPGYEERVNMKKLNIKKIRIESEIRRKRCTQKKMLNWEKYRKR